MNTQDIIANAGFGIWHIYIKDGLAPRMQANEKMCELLAIDASNMTEEEIYLSWYDRITKDAIPSVQASVQEMIDGKFSENTYLWNHPTKGDIYVRCGGTCEDLDDGTHVLSGYHADVTDIVLKDQKAKEDEQTINENLRRINADLEEAAAENEAQIEEITALNEELESQREAISAAYGMIKGFSQEYHTIWVVSKDTLEMRLIRSSGVSTIKNAVQMGYDYPKFDEGFEKYINTYVDPADRKRMRKEIHSSTILKKLKNDGIYAVNYLRLDDNGNVGYHQIAFANADSEDGKRQFVYGFRDIDKLVREENAKREEFRLAKEAAEAANNAKTSFLFNMSHDIRTPMNAIIGFTNLLEKYQDNPEKRSEYITKINDSSTILLSIINNVLEMARIEKGTIEMNETAWSAEQFNDTLYSVFAEMMENKHLTFTRLIDVAHPYVFCDSTKLREIFINILSNAYKYTNSGGTVSMELHEIPSDKVGFALYQTTITDTGIGMAADFLPHLFEEFARESNSSANKIEGTGLGMPIVKRLVELMNGTIEVTSQKNVGTTFVVTIPHRIASKENLTNYNGADIDTTKFKGKRILLAEDNDLNAEIATEILIDAGFEIERAENGKAAVDKLFDSPVGYYDLILMDVQMPEMNGYEATLAIRTMGAPAHSSIPILAMTANAFEEDKQNATKSGMNGHIAKPIDIGVLMKELAKALG